MAQTSHVWIYFARALLWGSWGQRCSLLLPVEIALHLADFMNLVQRRLTLMHMIQKQLGQIIVHIASLGGSRRFLNFRIALFFISSCVFIKHLNGFIFISWSFRLLGGRSLIVIDDENLTRGQSWWQRICCEWTLKWIITTHKIHILVVLLRI